MCAYSTGQSERNYNTKKLILTWNKQLHSMWREPSGKSFQRHIFREGQYEDANSDDNASYLKF